MAKKRHSAEQIELELREAEVELAKGGSKRCVGPATSA